MSRAFRISMDGAQQVPAVPTSASGLGTAVYDSGANTLEYTIIVKGVDFGDFPGQFNLTPSEADDVNGAHFHAEARGANGPIELEWSADDDFTLSYQADGSWTIHGIWDLADPDGSFGDFDDGLAAAILGADFGLYANIHTTTNGGGEIRGQFVCMATDAGETVNGTAGKDILFGLGGNDRLFGEAAVDQLDGGVGNDLLNGGLGRDILRGGRGNDTYTVDNPGDLIVEIAGQGVLDKVLTTVSYVLGAGAQIEQVQISSTTPTKAINLTGNEFANRLIGNAGANTLNGLGGKDALSGNAGNDRLVGGLGTDRLNGGLDADRFDFNAANESVKGSGKSDLILGFNHGQGDRIDVSTIDANGTTNLNQKFTFIGDDTFEDYKADHPLVKGMLRYFNGVVQGDINANLNVDFEIRVAGKPALLEGDFVL